MPSIFFKAFKAELKSFKNDDIVLLRGNISSIYNQPPFTQPLAVAVFSYILTCYTVHHSDLQKAIDQYNFTPELVLRNSTNMTSAATRATRLRELHIPGSPVVFANVYDPATAKIVAQNPSSAALATASFAIAAVHGLDDDDLDLETNLAAVRRIAPVAFQHNKPLSVDLQDGYGDRLEEAVEGMIAAGVSGCNLEDRDNRTGTLFSLDEAVSRVRRVVETARKAGVSDFVLNARTDTVLLNSDIEVAVARGRAFLEAGATTVFVWGGPKRGLSRDEVVSLVDALGGRLNVIACDGGLTIQELSDIGVARISVGPRLWRAANAAVEREAAKLLNDYAAVKSKSK